MNRIKETLGKIDDWFGYRYPVLFVLYKTVAILFIFWFIICVIKYAFILFVFLSITPPWER